VDSFADIDNASCNRSGASYRRASRGSKISSHVLPPVAKKRGHRGGLWGSVESVCWNCAGLAACGGCNLVQNWCSFVDFRYIKEDQRRRLGCRRIVHDEPSHALPSNREGMNPEDVYFPIGEPPTDLPERSK